MRVSTLCMLSVTLAAASLCGHQVSAATLTVRTPTPTVHVPPPKVTVHAPKVQVHDISVTKNVDKSSPNLYRTTAAGKHISKASQSAYDKSEQPSESASFNFTKTQLDYQTQK